MNHREFMQEYEHQLDPAVAKTPYELLFATQVLSAIEDLIDFSYLLPQHSFADAQGRQRRIDFALTEPNGVRVAIEIDGYDKTGSGGGMTPREFEDWLFREASLASLGWRVIRFPNSMVKKNSTQCAVLLRATIEVARAELDHPEVGLLRDGLAAAHAQLSAQETKVELMEAELASAGTTDQGRLRDQLRTAQQEIARLSAEVTRRELEEGAAVRAARDPRLTASPDVDRLNQARAAEFRDLARQLQQSTEEIGKMKRLATVFAITIVVVVAGGIALVMILSPSGDDPGGGEPAAQCDGTVSPERARTCVGQSVTVRGLVANSGNTDDTVYLNLDAPYPDPSRFVIVVPGSTEAWGERLEGRSVEVEGPVEYLVEEVPGIEVVSEHDVRVG
jgi:hypothetical protein